MTDLTEEQEIELDTLKIIEDYVTQQGLAKLDPDFVHERGCVIHNAIDERYQDHERLAYVVHTLVEILGAYIGDAPPEDQQDFFREGREYVINRRAGDRDHDEGE